jgi:hypothetical protein
MSQSVIGLNPRGAEAIAIGRLMPVFAGNTFVFGGDNDLRRNFSYDFKLMAQQDGVVDGKPTASWLFIDNRLGNGETCLQIHRVDGGNLKDFGEGQSFFVDRAPRSTTFVSTWLLRKIRHLYRPILNLFGAKDSRYPANISCGE